VNRKLESRARGREGEQGDESRISIAFKSLSNLGNWTNWHWMISNERTEGSSGFAAVRRMSREMGGRWASRCVTSSRVAVLWCIARPTRGTDYAHVTRPISDVRLTCMLEGIPNWQIKSFTWRLNAFPTTRCRARPYGIIQDKNSYFIHQNYYEPCLRCKRKLRRNFKFILILKVHRFNLTYWYWLNIFQIICCTSFFKLI